MLRLAISTLLLLTVPAWAAAQDRRPSHCIAVADAGPNITYLHHASGHADIADEFTVRIRYLDHSMFLIRTFGGLAAVTDYRGWIGVDGTVPDVVTMNNAHSSHWTAAPDPAIPHVLEGWRQGEAPAEHYLDLGEMLVRNVTTDVRGFGAGPIPENNSIFVFEAAGLCIGHLGHLHHEPTDEDYAALGRVDVLMAAVDGGYTVDLGTMTRIVERLKSRIILPMHWFTGASLERFIAGLDRAEFDVAVMPGSQIDVSLRSLPERPTVIVLRPLPLGIENP